MVKIFTNFLGILSKQKWIYSLKTGFEQKKCVWSEWKYDQKEQLVRFLPTEMDSTQYDYADYR